MKARTLIQNASYTPDQLKVIGKAFDDAWLQIAPTISKRPEAVEAARLKLANAILGAAKALPGAGDEQIKELALRIMLNPPAEL